MNRIFDAFVIAVTAMAVLVAVFFALNAYIYHEKQGSAEHISLEGIIVCLPHAGPGPHTKECAAGLRTQDGAHYALEFVLTSEALPEFQTGDRLSARGVLIARDGLPEHLTKYDLVGLFSITDAIHVTPGS